MADRIKKGYKKFSGTFLGSVIIGFIYAAMLIAVFMCFTGNGTFIYEF